MDITLLQHHYSSWQLFVFDRFPVFSLSFIKYEAILKLHSEATEMEPGGGMQHLQTSGVQK